MKKICGLLLTGLMIFSLAACGGGDASADGPEGVVEEFCKALQKYDIAAMAACMEDGDEAISDPFADGDAATTMLVDYLTECAANTTYTIEEPTVDGDSATVTVQFSYEDCADVMTAALTEYVSQAMTAAAGGAAEEEVTELFAAVLRETADGMDAPIVDASVEFTCTKTDGGWKISDASDELMNVMTCNMTSPLAGI